MSDLNNDFQTQELIKKLELLRDIEAEKPIEEMDVSLLTTCVEFILELRGETEILSPEEVEEKVRKIPFVDTTSLNTSPENVKSKTTKIKSRKILLIAAITSLLITIFTFSSIAYNWDVFAEIKHIIFENINAICFAICYSLYTCLLYTLAYARLYPIRTESFNKMIEKYQIYMLAFFPLIAYPLFLHLTNASLYLCAFGIINLTAFNLVGIKSTQKNRLNIVLIIIFTFVAFSTLEISDATISQFDIDFSFKDFIVCLGTIFALISAIKLPEKFIQHLCKNLHNIEKKKEVIIQIIKHPRYVASFSSSFSLLLLSLMAEEFIIGNKINSYSIIIYIVTNVLISILRVYLEYLKIYTID